MFFPELKRRNEKDYLNNLAQFYADYRQNYSKVSEDCKHRCVYCDITVNECGGDEMQLDHFRPQKHFKNLDTHPYNLYLSCPKCNVLKTSDWPCSKNTDDAPSFIGGVGYLDRFEHKADNFLRVEEDGTIVHLAGPVNYMIKKMKLNRASRVNIRRRRKIESKKTKLLEGIERLTNKLIEDCSQSKINGKELSLRLTEIKHLFSMCQEV
ncbi:HNH endonuclease [Shewanella sp. YLB-07]|uniref:HNH endonuclease n=1 Tax=Shewanella sp. YLB-07 TaxID=2601268 RepID=UPI001884109C|nr:HNH endonuclease signature motif containing protein [Shewanella sp. YLB-07]